ncbi:MAG: enoyl-CoA hydratase-related protein [Antricoccus sp.]
MSDPGTTPIIEDISSIRWITLNRPRQLNALRVADLDVIYEAITAAPHDVRAIAITGAGDRAMGAGMHTETFQSLDKNAARAVISKVGRAVGAIRLCPKPTAIVLNGYCLGAAFEMALAADLRIAHHDVIVGLPETKLGIPSVVDAALLQNYVGLSLAKEMILTGDLYRAADITPSIINRWAQPLELHSVATALLGKLTSLTPQVIAAQKDLFETWLNAPLQDGIAHSIEVFADCFDHPATRAAVEAYRRKEH